MEYFCFRESGEIPRLFICWLCGCVGVDGSDAPCNTILKEPVIKERTGEKMQYIQQ